MSIQWFERLVGSLRGPGAKRSRKRLNDALRPTRRQRRHALRGFESLEERRVLAAVLGIGTSALVGNDLTDLGNNGVEGSYSPPSNLAGFDGVFFANLKPNFGATQAAFNVFDNRAGGAGDDKALWGFPATVDQSQPQIVGANFATTHGPTVLTSFTITSGEDTPERDPTRWKIEGSNDTTTGLNGTWTTIYDKAVGGSHWTQRQQVNRYSPTDGDVFLTSQPFTAFRMVTTATGFWTMGTPQEVFRNDIFQLSEIEFFGVPGNSSTPAVNLSVSSATGTEAGTTAITVTATAASAVSGAQTVSLAVTGTGIASSDYALSNSNITIPNGATTGTVTLSVKDDLLNEGTETATLTISSPSAGITLGTTRTQNIAITDDDSAGTSTYGLPVTGAYRVVRNGSTIEIYDSTLVLVASRAMGTAAVVINGTSGNDSLTIDLSGGNFTVPITFNGGSQTSTPGDSLALTGGTFTTGTFAFTNANDGTINLTGNSQINYTGLEPIVTTGTTINDLILAFNAGAESITLTDATGAAMTIDSTHSESLTFANPSSSLTINAGTGDDIINITIIDAAFRGAVSINGDAGTDTVNWDAAATLGSASATGNISVVADVITVTNAISADTGRMIAVSLAATGNVTLSGANADVTTGGGTFTVNADSDANGSGTFTSDNAGSAVSALGGAISIKAADVVLTGTLAATSILTLVPSTAGRTIGIGGGAGTFNLNDAELALLTDGFSSITIGDAAAGNIDFNSATFTDSVVLNTSGRVNDETGADINVSAGNTLTINGSVAPGQSPGILNVTGNLLLNAIPTVLLADDFNDNSIDPAKWNVVTAGISQPGASVIETGGRIQLTGRGHLNTSAALNPNAPGGLVITGTWQFGSGDDFLSILTRSDGTPVSANFGDTRQGIELHIRDNKLSIAGKAGATVIGGTGITIPQGVSAGDIFEFTLTDNGTTITGKITEVGVPANTATVTATSNFVSATNLVTFHNRESNRVSYLDNVVIRSALLAGYNAEIGGTTPGESATSHDQINVAGTVTIGSGVTLNLSNFMSNYTPTGGDQLVIVNNDASDAIIGTFVMGSGGTDSNGGQLADGDTITNFLGSGRNFRIFYSGGDGNDVVLVENSTPAVVYVDDSFTANVGQTIADADLGTTGSQPAIFGATAFTTINAALAAVTSSGTIIVNGGTYAETVSLTGTRTMEITGPNSAQTVIIDDLTTIAGTPVVIEGSSNLTGGDADSRTLAGVISGSGSFTKQGTGTYTLTASNLYTGATNINAGTLRTAATTSAPAGAVGIYTFDSVSGATVNNAGSAGVGKNGALVAGSAVVGGGRIGNAMSTSGGSGARMEIAGAGISLAGVNWTGAAWFNNLFTDGDWNTLFVDSNTADSQLIIQAGTNRLGVYTSEFRSSGFDLVPALNSGWHHVAAVGSGATTTFYRDGVLVGTADRKSGTNITSVGASPAGGGMQRFAQLIDDVYIYQSALTAAQIMTLYNSGASTAANSIPDSSTVTIASGAFLDLNASSETIGSLAGAGTVTSGIAGSPTLTVGGGNGSGSFSGAVQNGAGTISLAKTGTGTQTLSGSNLYTGATAVNNGTLVINGSVTSNVTVTTPGVLNGSGTVTGNVLGNGTFSPGNSPGIMTIVGNFTPSGTVNFEVNSAWTMAGTHFDQYLVTGLVNMAGSTVTFTNTADASGPAANSVIKLIDNNGTLDLTTAPTMPTDGAIVTIGSRSFKLFYNGGDGNDVTLESQNAAPTAANSSVTTNEDFTYTFSATDFNFSDTDSSDVLSAVKVTTIESAGDLEWFNGSSWVGVTQDQEISKADIDANRLRFIPAANANGSPYATISFKVQDTGGPVLSVAAYMLTINVLAINDLPVALTSSVTTNEDTSKTFAMGDFLFTDVEGDSLASITISSLNLASGDTLKLSGTDVTVGQTITAADIPNLVYASFSDANGMARSTFGFTANDAGSGTVAATMTINVTAVNDVSISDASVTEGGNLQFTVSLDSPVDVDTVITFSTADGSATTADSDYTGQTLQTLNIPAGQTSGTITIVTTADNSVEFDETMSVQLTGVNASGRNATIDDGSGQGMILNDDTATVSIGDASVTEGGNLVFVVSLSNPVDLDTIVTYSTQNGTATAADNDYIGQTGLTVTIPAGSTTAQITVMTTADNKVERNEEISVSLTGVSNDLLAYYNFDGQSNNQYGTAPNATLVNTAFIGTGGSGYTGAAADGALDLGGLNNRAAALVGSGPHFDSAYNNNSIAVSFWQYDRGTDRASSFWIDSPQVDGSRGFQAHNPWDGGIIFDNSGCCTPATRQFAQGGVQGQWQHFVFQKDAAGNKQIWIDGSLRQSQMVGAAPLLPFDGNMTIGAENLVSAGGRSLNGKIDEFAVWSSALSPADIAQLAGGASTLSLAARDVVLGDIQGLGSIFNDDTATVSINNPSVLETNSGTTTLAFTVSLDKPVDVAVSATINTANGTTNPATTADNDYVALTNGTVTFSAGSTSQTVNVTINGDSKLELNEQLQLVLSALSASGRSVQFTGAAATLTAIGTITNDDTPRVGTILQPTSVTTTMGSFGAPWAATKMIDNSGLSVGYTSNVTNFDTYIAGNPTHSHNAHQITPANAQAWASSNSVLTGTITFNLGSMFVVESMALWNRIDAGIGGFNLLADADGDFNSGAVTVLSNRTASLGRSGAQVFGFTPTTAQYLRLQVLSDAHSFPFVIINEIAFEGTQITIDATPPTSQITALSPNSSSLVIPITVTGSDGGPLISGVKEYDLYYSTGGGFVKFATVPASSPSTTFTGAANTTYWFRSLARDNAGNEETKTTSDTSTRFGDVAPPATRVTTAVPTSGGLFTVSMTGSKATGSALAAFDVYVSIDDGAAVLIRSANAVSLGGGNYSGKIPFQGILDGTSHTYRFYSRGRDDAGNVEPAPVVADLSVTNSFAAAGLKATAIDVQKGANQRSYVRNLDILFSSAAGLSDLLAAGRVKVERFGIDATSVSPGTGSLVTGFGLTQADNSLRLDFGFNGLGGLREAGNGFYRILIDQDGNNSFGDPADTAFEFFRLWGDANGDGKVDSTDLSSVTSQVGRVGNNVDGDLDGNGVVNSLDRLFATQQNGKKLRDSLFGWLDD